MDPAAWFGASWEEVGAAALSTVAIFAAVILATRLGGLRSLSKMSAFDFAMTVAVGSVMATVAVTDASLVVGVVGVATLYAIQTLVAVLRLHLPLSRVVDNTPLLLMADGRPLEANLARARVTLDDLRGKLREANVLRFSDVRAVVMETTGDITVLHGEGELDPQLLQDVRGAERLR